MVIKKNSKKEDDGGIYWSVNTLEYYKDKRRITNDCKKIMKMGLSLSLLSLGALYYITNIIYNEPVVLVNFVLEENV